MLRKIKVRKRDGSLENFNLMKIAKAIYKAKVESGRNLELDECVEDAKAIMDELIYIHTQDIIDIEEIQDRIEYYFLKNDEIDVYKSFIFYREKRKQDRLNPWSNNDERQDLILQKYTIPGETKAEFLSRISLGNSKLLKIFRNKEAIWGGRNLYAIGREGNISGSNCYTVPMPEDSMESIYDTAYQIARTYSYGGGQGMNLSNLRPKGAKVNNSSNTSPGPITFMELYSFITLNTQQENRRGALMIMLNDNHPDIIDFITSKLDLTKINGANISIAISDDFMRAFENDEMWEMVFETRHEIIKKKVKARELMEVIAYANSWGGDPGMFFIDTANNYHLLSEYKDVKFNTTNPCGELFASR